MTLETKSLTEITKKDIHAAGGYCRCGQKILVLAERGPDKPHWIDVFVKCGNRECNRFIRITMEVSA